MNRLKNPDGTPAINESFFNGSPYTPNQLDPAETQSNGEFHNPKGPSWPGSEPYVPPKVCTLPSVGLADEVLGRAMADAAIAKERRNRAYRIRLERAKENYSAKLKTLLESSGSNLSGSLIGRNFVAILACMVSGIGAASWWRWIASATNDNRLAISLAGMLAALPIGLHFGIWRSHLAVRTRALNWITACLVLSGLALMFAVAQNYGFDAPDEGEMSAWGAEDNRLVMVPADILCGCCSLLLLAWSEDIADGPVVRLQNRIADCEARLVTLRAGVHMAVNRAYVKGLKKLLGANPTHR